LKQVRRLVDQEVSGMFRTLAGAVLCGLVLSMIVCADEALAQNSIKGLRSKAAPTDKGYSGLEAHSQPQKNNPTLHSTMTLAVSQGGDGQAHLCLSRSLMNDLHAEAADPRPSWQAMAPSPGATVMAGVALSLGFVLTGFWFVRTRPRRLLILPTLFLTAIVAAGVGGCIWPAKPAPSMVAHIPAEPLHDEAGHLIGEALLEVNDKIERPQVVLSREALLVLLENARPAEDPNPK
jgi:hypothetical protein